MKYHGYNRTNADCFSFYKGANSPFGVQLNERTADGCTYETVLEPESERVEFENLYYAGNPTGYIDSSGDLVNYPGQNANASSIQRIYAGESITWNHSPVSSENQTFVGISYQYVAIGFQSINYCWYVTLDGFAYIFEDGVMVPGFSVAYSSDSKFKIAREGGEIVYIMDDVVYRTLPDVYPDLSMVADITIYDIPGVGVAVRSLMINRMAEFQYADCGEASGINRKYRYGFQGQEKDDEVKDAGNSYDFGARFYDSRLGRWLSLDAYFSSYPQESPYNFAINSPILMVDPNGNWVEPKFITKEAENQYKTVLSTIKSSSILSKNYNLINGWSNMKETEKRQSKKATYGTTFHVVVREMTTQEKKNAPGAAGFMQPKGFQGVDYKGERVHNMVNADIAIGSNGFNFSTIAEEMFHAGQHRYYTGIQSQRNSLSMEVEAKYAKAAGFYEMNQGLSGDDLFQSMVKNGFSEYEISPLFVTKDGKKEINPVIDKEFNGIKLDAEEQKVWDKIVDNLGANIDKVYSSAPGYKTGEKIDKSFKYYKSLKSN